MNLNAIVSPVIGAVNPMISIGVLISTGPADTQPDGTRPPTYATPGSFTGSIADTVLTVTAVTSGVLQPGQALAGAAAGTVITEQLSGDDGGIGTYSVNKPQTLASTTLTTSLVLRAQLQPISWRDLQQLEGVNMNGTRSAIYVNGNIDAIVRVKLKGGDLVTFNGDTWLVVQQLEGWNATAGWTKAAIVLQDGA